MNSPATHQTTAASEQVESSPPMTELDSPQTAAPGGRPRRPVVVPLDDGTLGMTGPDPREVVAWSGLTDASAVPAVVLPLITTYGKRGKNAVRQGNASLAMFGELNPRGPLEAILATRIVATTTLIDAITAQLNSTWDSTPNRDRVANQLDKFSKLLAKLIADYQRLQHPEQRIVVQRVEVNGGQTVVGDVVTPGGRLG